MDLVSSIVTYLFIVLGIIISVILPILRQSLPAPKEGVRATTLISRLWPIAKPYVSLGAFSILAGLVMFAFAGATLANWSAALLFGYAFDSTLQKLKTRVQE